MRPPSRHVASQVAAAGESDSKGIDFNSQTGSDTLHFRSLSVDQNWPVGPDLTLRASGKYWGAFGEFDEND